MNLKSKILNRRALALFLLPIVTLGMFYVYKNASVNEIYAVDPLQVTIDGVDATLAPMFDLDDMKPGDTYTRCFNVKNTSPEEVAVEMTGFKTLEEKNFTEILELEIVYTADNSVIFSGLLKDYFTSPAINLGSFAAGADRTYCISVYFPHEAGNVYQLAKVVFDIVWRTELPDEIPPECEHLRNQIADVIYGTEDPDIIHGNIQSNLIIALGGDDEVDSSASSDCVILGEGDDIVDSEGGDDVVLGGPGNDEIESGSGNDRVWAGEGNDVLDLESGDDLAYGEAGDDNIDAGADNDTVYGGSGNDQIRGGIGFDFLYGNEGDDVITGNSDDDYLDGGIDYDDLDGGGNTDTCINGEVLDSCEL